MAKYEVILRFEPTGEYVTDEFELPDDRGLHQYQVDLAVDMAVKQIMNKHIDVELRLMDRYDDWD